MKKIPYLPAVRTKLDKVSAGEIMDSTVVIHENSTHKQLRDLSFNKVSSKIALVDENSYILADFNISCIQKYLLGCIENNFKKFTKEEAELIIFNIKNENFLESKESSPVLERKNSSNMAELFWDCEIDFNDSVFKLNKSPITVQTSTPLIKVHFLFLMLGLMQIYVTKDYKVVGNIYRHYFTKVIK